MIKTKLNKWQKKNLESKKIKEKVYGKWEKIPPEKLISEPIARWYCVECGDNVTGGNVEYFRRDVLKVLCYNCQKKIK